MIRTLITQSERLLVSIAAHLINDCGGSYDRLSV
jgi:hypothetical protein